MGDPLGSPRVAPLFASRSSRLSSLSSSCFFLSPSRTPLSQNGPRDPMSDSGRMGPTGPPNAAADGKRPRNAPEMADFGGRDGAQRGKAQLSTSWSSERASRAYAARRVTPPVRKVRPSVSFDVPSGSPPLPDKTLERPNLSGCDHTSTNAPDPIRTPKLSVLGRE